MQVDIDMILEREDLDYVIANYLISYKFHSQNRLPKSIIIPYIEDYKDAGGNVIPVSFVGEQKPIYTANAFLAGMPTPTVNLKRLEEAAKASEEAAKEVEAAFKLDPNAKALSEKDKARVKELQSTSLPGSVFEGAGHETGRDTRLTAEAIAKDLTEPDDEAKLEAEEEEAASNEEIIKNPDGSVSIKSAKKGPASATS